MLSEIEGCVTRRESFALETILSGLGSVARIRQWRAMGYELSFYFLILPSQELAILRVAARFRQGGHSIPESVNKRCFAAGLTNVETIYKFEVDCWAKFDNLGDRPVLMEWGKCIREACGTLSSPVTPRSVPPLLPWSGLRRMLAASPPDRLRSDHHAAWADWPHSAQADRQAASSGGAADGWPQRHALRQRGLTG